MMAISCTAKEGPHGSYRQQTKDLGYIITGVIVPSPNNGNVYLLKTDSNGDSLWTRQFGGNNTDIGYFVRQTKDGGYIICGESANFGGGIYIIKTDSLGLVHTGTGIAEHNNPFEFSLFPNPTSGIFTIQAKGIARRNSVLEIYNINSQSIYSGKINNNETLCIDLSNQPNGLYMALLRFNNTLVTRKIILQN